MKYITLEKGSITNGPGLRTVLWVSGCSHQCYKCHNPETWDCGYGENYTDEVFDKIIDSMKIASGLTLSGGDPMFEGNRDEILKLCRRFKEECPDKNIWMWTGYKYEEIQDFLPEILNYIDIIIDGPFIHSLKSPNLKYRGSSNQRVIDVKKSVKERRVVQDVEIIKND